MADDDLHIDDVIANKITAVDYWNARHKPGIEVDMELDNGDIIHTRTRSEAIMLGGHTPVIWLDDIRGAYSLYRVTPRK